MLIRKGIRKHMGSRDKIWQQGEYENAKGWATFFKWITLIAVVAVALGIPAAIILGNQDSFEQ